MQRLKIEPAAGTAGPSSASRTRMEEAARPLPLSRQAVTVGEQVVSEGLADAFACRLYGDELGYTRIGVPHLHDLSLEVPRSA